MFACFEFIKNMLNFALFINEEANTVNAVIGASHKFLFTPYTKLLGNLVIFIRKQGEIERLFLNKLSQFFWRICADA